ncbi:MAG: hypothetical protein JOZ82_04120, partial [Marmoricola sp.]|nr:hypothetical protein [Marmoricola sp.]
MTLLRNLAQRVRGPGATEPGSPGAGSAHELLDRHAAQLPENPQRVVLLADAASAGEVEDLLAVLPTARVAVISTAPSETWQGYGHDLETFTESTLDQINWRMRFLAGADLCIDMATRTPEEYGGLWHRLFLHLEPGAAYVIDRRHDPRTPVPDQLLDAAASQGLEPATLRASYSQPARRRAVASVFVDADCIIVRKRGHHLLKVRERLADRLLPAREPDLGVARLAEVPAQEVTCAATVVSHTSSRPMKWLDTTMKAPALFLRHYEGEIAMVSNGLLVSGTSILPDSFRHHVGGHLSNPVLIDSSGDHGQLRARARAHKGLEGSYHNLDSENSCHYENLLT